MSTRHTSDDTPTISDRIGPDDPRYAAVIQKRFNKRFGASPGLRPAGQLDRAGDIGGRGGAAGGAASCRHERRTLPRGIRLGSCRARDHRHLGLAADYLYAVEVEAKNLAWVRAFDRDLFAESGGVPVPGDACDGAFINHPDTDLADPTLNTSGVPWHTLYYKDNYPRLQAVKARWDPRDVFTHALAIRME